VGVSIFERIAIRLGRISNETERGKRWQELFLRSVGHSWVSSRCAYRTLVEGLDGLTSLIPDRGVMLVANHRSFFDQYVMMTALLKGPTPWARRFYFPVRSNFFYENPVGIILNFAASAGTMYPPIFRQRGRMEMNKDALHRVNIFLRRSGTLVGMHPEGVRNKGYDPYQLLPAQYGVGQIALQAKPIVIPVYINGLSNNIFYEIRANRIPAVRRESPVITMFGSPLDYQSFENQSPRLSVYKKLAEFFNSEISKLSYRERALRAQCASGTIADDDPRWLCNRRTARLTRVK